MQPPDPLGQLHKYVADARREIAAEAYAMGSTTFDRVVLVNGRINRLEGLVSGYLEALAATRPDLARQAVAEVQCLLDDIHAITLTAPGPVADDRPTSPNTLSTILGRLGLRPIRRRLKSD